MDRPGSTRSTRPRDVLPRDLAGDVGLLRQAEHPLAEDVAHDVGRAALDGVGLGAQEAPDDLDVVVATRSAHHTEALAEVGAELLALPRDAADALEVDRELLEPLVELGLHQLRDRAFGAGLGPALALVARPLVVEPDEPA